MTNQQHLLKIISTVTADADRSEKEIFENLISVMNKEGVSFSEYEVVSALEMLEKTKNSQVVHNLKLMLSE